MIRTSLLLLCSLFTLFTAPGPAAEANTEEEGMDNGLYARIQTNRGDILLKLYADKTPPKPRRNSLARVITGRISPVLPGQTNEIAGNLLRRHLRPCRNLANACVK